MGGVCGGLAVRIEWISESVVWTVGYIVVVFGVLAFLATIPTVGTLESAGR